MDMFMALKNLVRKHNPQCLFLMETKGNKEWVSKIVRTLGFSGHEIVEANGLVEGLAFYWTEEVEVNCIWTTGRAICCNVKSKGIDEYWKLMGVYGTPYRRENEEFWNWLEHVVADWRDMWLLIGDFNKILNNNKKYGGKTVYGR